ncbi:PKD domain-containing protein [Archangium sp.]|uniref:PKD domain-containing protein n=1 Tax=Archangium sp. TaxID=1872627 RepID=UPI00286A0C64|nr:hypothetical protein [Archangium sp.]
MNTRSWGARAMSWTLALLFVSVAAGCGGDPPAVSQNGSMELRVALSQASSPADVKGIRVEVRGPGIPAPLTTELTQVGGVWQGTVTNIPAGTDRVVEGFAYDATAQLLYKGSSGAVTIASGATASVNLMLQPLNPPVPYENEAPRLDSFVVSSTQVLPGGSITLSATAHDPNGDALSFSWTGSAGAFSSPASPATTWTAPGTEGVQLLRLQVTDSKGTSVTASVEILVQRPGATGNAQVTIGFNTWPEVRTMQATPSPLAFGKPTRLSVTAVDADGDTLSYSWTTECRGSFIDTTTSTPTFTLEQPPSSGRCAFRVTVLDSKRAQNTGVLGVQAGSAPNVNLPPVVDGIFQSSPEAGPGERVTLGLSARDPEGKALTFSWHASGGTLQNPRWTPTHSETDWVAPPCFDAPIAITATVADMDGGATKQVFSISPRPSAKCGGLSVTGVRNITYIQADGTTQWVPADLTTFSIGAWVQNATGTGYEYRTGTGAADGTFVIPNVDKLPVLLKVGTSSYYWVNSRTLDLSYATLGRPGVEQEPTGTQLTLAINGISPWKSSDDLQLHSTGVGLAYYTVGCSTPYSSMPADGSLDFTGTYDYVASMRNCGNVPARFEPSRGDSVLVNQLVSRDDLGAGIPTGVELQELRRTARISPVTSVGPDGTHTVLLQGTLTSLPTRPQGINVLSSQYEGLALQSTPGATLYQNLVYISTLPRFSEFGQYAGVPDLAFAINPQPGQGELSLSFEYGNPYPTHWQRMVTTQSSARVPFAAEQPDGSLARPSSYTATASTQTLLLDGSRPMLTPRVGAAQDLRINGLTTSPTAGKLSVGPTPLVSWRAPTLGTAHRYQLRLYELVVSPTGGTTRVQVANLTTPQTQLQLPPGLLLTGKVYYFQLSAIFAPGYDPTLPNRTGPDYDYVTALSGKFQP